MKIAIPSSDKIIVSDHFGRAQLFAVYNSEDNSFKFIVNEAVLNKSHGAGMQSAVLLINNGVDIVLSYRVGPKAFDMLKSAKIKMYLLSEPDLTVENALAQYNKGELELLEKSNR